jgi:hypothetical protein
LEHVLTTDADILLLTETWLKDCDTAVVNELCPSGYTFLGRERRGRRGGGIGLTHRDHMCLQVKQTPQMLTFEHMFVQSRHFNVLLVYRPPVLKPPLKLDDFLREFNELLLLASDVQGELVIAGDFNLHIDNISSPGTARFLELLNNYDLQQHVTQSTHSGGHVLDLVITCSEHPVTDVQVVDYSLSDHSSVIFDVHSDYRVVLQDGTAKCIRDFRKLDVVKFKDEFSHQAKNIITDTTMGDPNQLLANYTSIVTSTLDRLCPMVARRPRKRASKPWYNETIHVMRQLLRVNERVWRKTRLEIHRQIYTQHRNHLCAEVTKAKKQYYQSQLEGADQRKAFQVVSELLSFQQPKCPDSIPGSRLCDVFAEFFDSKILKIRLSIDSLVGTCPEPSLFVKPSTTLETFTETTIQEVNKLIMASKSKTCSLDIIPTDILKETLSLHTGTITELVNQSFKSGIFPDEFKRATVTPLLKKDNLDRNILKNYRPVSGLNFIGKLLEKVASKRLVAYFDANNLQDEFQSAYRIHHSTETALSKVKHDITMDMDRNQAVILVLLDMSAAFDTIEINQLLTTLKDYFGVHNTALKWIQSYMSNRFFSVQVAGESSNWKELRYGVPQGSVLGPLLFGAYTTPIRHILTKHHVHYHKFADDLQIYVSYNPAIVGEVERIQQQLKECIEEVQQWMLFNKLKLNAEKTEYITFLSPTQLRNFGLFNIQVGDVSISPVTEVRNLGAYMNTHNTVKAQVDAVCKKCNYHLRRIGSIRRYITRDIAKGVVVALILSNLDYCNALLAGGPTTQIDRLDNILNRAARVVERASYKCHITPLLKNLHWLPVNARIQYKVALLVYKALHGLAPSYLESLFQKRTRDPRLRQIYDVTDLQPQRKVKEASKQALGQVGPTVWNNIPPAVRHSASLPLFKKNLKTYLFLNNFK